LSLPLITKLIFALIVLFVSFLGAIYLPTTEILKGLISLPGVGALFYTLLQLFRDDWQHALLQNKQQDFILSTSSHVADVAYDKHVLFCEAYIQRIQKGRQELFREGASPLAMSIGRDLVVIRQEHSAWLTDEIESQLKPFENALIEIGAQEHYLEMTAGQGMDEKKKEIIDKIYKSFGLVMGHEKPNNDIEADLHIDKVIDKIRDILGIKAMTKLRIQATKVALKRLNGE
jgi:hypothetical protein